MYITTGLPKLSPSNYTVSSLVSVVGWQLLFSLLSPFLMVMEMMIMIMIAMMMMMMMMMQVVEMGRAGRMALVRDLGGQGHQAVADVQKKGEDGKNSQWLMTECPNNN